MCAVRSLASLGLCGFFAVVARRGVWRLLVFFVIAGASESGAVWFVSSLDFVFFGTGVEWLNDFNSFIVHGLLRKCFLVLIVRSDKLVET